jgi:fucose 4-O-acetylase-like acetyltransferase
MPKWMDLGAFVLLALINTIFVVSFSLIFKKVNTFFDLAYAYSNPLVIIAALYLFLFFSKIKMPYIKVVNWLGASSLAVYLFHGETTIRNRYFCPIIQNIYNNYSGVECLGMIFLFLCAIYLISVIVDQLRLLSWNKIYQ